ncbi:VanZ family protein [Listeria booriae]|uniref:VanZ family protein n=1 Tax=Listeria booriae TaxID=1552123 RepID=A0A842B741_9LIST|nr:VanZ family protein [Listeria booriae]MBC1798308.1 VanZ family protein [Listeria booriae]
MISFVVPSLIIIVFSTTIFLILFFKRRISGLKLMYLVLFSVYISSLISITFFPMPIQQYLIDIMIEDRLGFENNFVPFRIFSDVKDLELTFMISVILRQVVGNIILFVPLGFSLPIILSSSSMKKIVFIGFIVSLSIETIQWLLGLYFGYNYRATDIDDLIFNTIGSCIGYLLFTWIAPFLKTYELIDADKA